MSGRQIIFLGPVGVGKTTQILLLKEYLESTNRKTSRRYVKSFYSLILQFFVSRGGNFKSKTPIHIDHTFATRTMRLLMRVDLVFIVAIYFYTVHLFLKLGKTILIEESLIGTIMDYLDAERNGFISSKSYNGIKILLTKMVLRSKFILIIQAASPTALRNRQESRGFRIEERHYLETQSIMISELKKTMERNIILFDTSEIGVLATHQKIVSELTARNFL